MPKDKETSKSKGKGKIDETKVNLIPVSMTHNDWTYLHETSMKWDYFDSSDQLGRFESHSVSEKPLTAKFLVANWFGDNYANLLLAKSYLDALGFQWICLWDMAQHDNEEYLGWVLLTDYNADYYKH